MSTPKYIAAVFISIALPVAGYASLSQTAKVKDIPVGKPIVVTANQVDQLCDFNHTIVKLGFDKKDRTLFTCLKVKST